MKIQLFQPQAIYEMGGRKNQEDSIYPLMGEATDQNRVFVVCDGMGGMDKGEVASAAVRDALGKMCESLYDPQKPFTDEQFQQALEQAYDALDAADVRHEGTMGTTMTFICFHAGGCLVAHIGDSRIYHLRPSLGFPEGVRFRSRDHSLVQQLYDLGEISYHGMATSPRKNVILKAMQPYQDQRTKATFAHITDVKPGDYFYLCTDGMLEQMDDDELLGIIGNPVRTDEEKVKQLIELTQSNADNHSAYLLKVKDVEIDPVADNSLLSDERELRAKNKALNDTRKNEAWSEDVAPMAPVQNEQTEQKAAHSPQ
ncbi:MAG: serine/threonine-protein phosphatase, partial [Prevotella sp.]|nr:serine/threonine-protein phosphatase [Prevotella sp.]